jgi:hypothetical protein
MRFLVLFCENQIKHIFRNKLYIYLPSKYFEFRLELSFFLKNKLLENDMDVDYFNYHKFPKPTSDNRLR